MDIAKKFVLITNMEYTRRIATAYDIGYANGTKDTIHKVTNLTGATTKGKTTDELAWAKPNKSKTTKSKRKVAVKK